MIYHLILKSQMIYHLILKSQMIYHLILKSQMIYHLTPEQESTINAPVFTDVAKKQSNHVLPRICRHPYRGRSRGIHC
jgi:hypothetical protein